MKKDHTYQNWSLLLLVEEAPGGEGRMGQLSLELVLLGLCAPMV